jgi:hypothetical protein
MTMWRNRNLGQNSFMQAKTKFLMATLALSGLGMAAQATSWDLAADYNTVTPNPPWAYGEVLNTGNGFTPLAWTPVISPLTSGIYGNTDPYGAFIFQNTASYAAYGIAPGQVSLESDNGNAAVQWTAPATGVYDIVANIGGTQAGEGGGFGNALAYNAGLNVNGVSQTDVSFTGNVKSWNLTDVLLTAGQTVDAYVINPGAPGAGNTQTELTISLVPDGALTGGLLGGALLGLALYRRKWFV